MWFTMMSNSIDDGGNRGDENFDAWVCNYIMVGPLTKALFWRNYWVFSLFLFPIFSLLQFFFLFTIINVNNPNCYVCLCSGLQYSQTNVCALDVSLLYIYTPVCMSEWQSGQERTRGGGGIKKLTYDYKYWDIYVSYIAVEMVKG